MYHPWLTCMLVFILAMFSAEGGVSAETSPVPLNNHLNYAAEEWVKENAGSGEIDLTRRFEHENDRVLRATFLASLLTEPHMGLKSDRQGMRIVGAIVNGKLDLTKKEVPFNTELIECRFTDPVYLSGSSFLSGLSVEKSVFQSWVDLKDAKIGGTFQAGFAEFSGPVSFQSAQIAGNFEAPRTDFRNERGATIFEGMKVGGHVILDETKFSGPVSFQSAQITGNFEAPRTEFRNEQEATIFEGMKVGGHVILGETKFSGPVSFQSAQITGNFEAPRTEFRNERGATVFEGMKVGGRVILKSTKFSGPVSFQSAQITGNFETPRTEFRNPAATAFFGKMNVGGDVILDATKFSGPVSFQSAQITGAFRAPGAEFRNEKETATFENMKVGGDVILDETKFSGPVSFQSAQITGNFEAPVAEFRNPAATAFFGKMNVGRDVILDETKFSGPVSFQSAQITGNFEAPRTEFRNPAATAFFGKMNVGGDVSLVKTKFSGPVGFQSAQITGSLEAAGAEFSGPVGFQSAQITGAFRAPGAEFRNEKETTTFENMKVGGDVILDKTKFSGPVGFQSAQITGAFRAPGAEFRNEKETVRFNGMKVDGAVTFYEAVFRGRADMSDGRFLNLTIDNPNKNLQKNLRHYPELDLSRTVIARELQIRNSELGKIIATDLQVSGPTSLTNLTITDQLDLEQSTFVNVPSFSDVSLPKKDGLLLTGMKYQHLRAVNGQDPWEPVLKLINRAKYDASNYNALEVFFRGQGYFDKADEVFFAQKRRVREESSGWVQWAWSWFMNCFVRYGRRPELALLWSGIVVVLGSFMFRKKGMEALKPDSKPSDYHCLWYSLDVFVPVIKLQFADDWVPKQDRWFVRQYVYVHSLLGWILIPVGLAAVTGIIK